ncbi:hypothetical protein AVL50_31765 [Flammeovirga sp. SJP92]|nr:hypothetical protein AVL50_31765 [Flammeovirga sp. SJP92]
MDKEPYNLFLFRDKIHLNRYLPTIKIMASWVVTKSNRLLYSKTIVENKPRERQNHPKAYNFNYRFTDESKKHHKWFDS